MKLFNKKPDNALDVQIGDLHSQLMKEEVGSERYNLLMTALERTYAIRDKLETNALDANTKATIIANLAGILLMLNYERMHVISTKAMSQLSKLKI